MGIHHLGPLRNINDCHGVLATPATHGPDPSESGLRDLGSRLGNNRSLSNNYSACGCTPVHAPTVLVHAPAAMDATGDAGRETTTKDGVSTIGAGFSSKGFTEGGTLMVGWEDEPVGGSGKPRCRALMEAPGNATGPSPPCQTHGQG